MQKRDKKTAKKALFLAALFPIEIRTLSRIISLKCADFLELWELGVLSSVWFEKDEMRDFRNRLYFSLIGTLTDTQFYKVRFTESFEGLEWEVPLTTLMKS